MHNTQAEEYEDDALEDQQQSGISGLFARFKDALRSRHNDEYEGEEDLDEGSDAPIEPYSRAAGGSATPLRRGSGAPLRIETARPTRVTVRRMVQTLEDVRRAVYGLREGDQQIVNLEQTPSEMATRLTDFLEGAVYAMDGTVEKIGEHVYLYTPKNVTVNVEERGYPTGTRPVFLDSH